MKHFIDVAVVILNIGNAYIWIYKALPHINMWLAFLSFIIGIALGLIRLKAWFDGKKKKKVTSYNDDNLIGG